MVESVMKYGARKGKMNVMRRWIAKASARDIRIFPGPGADVLRMHQAKTGSDFNIALNPREANVLLVMGDVTDPLAQKAALAYQQIPRPRVLIVAGAEQPPHLPTPDVQISLSDNFLDKALPKVRQLLKHHAWSEAAKPWKPELLVKMVEDTDNGSGHDHHGHDHSRDEEHNNTHSGHNHDHYDHESDEHDHDHDDHDEDSGEDDHGDMDFMSMVAMTKDLPRPKDELPMNRSKVHFGPFYPGLSGGLSVFMELDGDTVIEAYVEGDLLARNFSKLLPVDTKKLPDLLARLNPLAPQTYRLLALKALYNALTSSKEPTFTPDELIMLENERIGSHLNWLATFAKTVGNEWMHQKSVQWHAISHHKTIQAERLYAFLEQIRSMPYLKTKLSVEGAIPDTLLHHLSGPAAKAAGKTGDSRSGDELYLSLGWEPITNTENNAWGRLLIRLDEIEQSYSLIEKAKAYKAKEYDVNFSESGEGSATLESPRGTVSLNLWVEDGKVQAMHIETPSKPLAGLVPTITKETELSDALVQVTSLDISPWEIRSKGAKVHK